MLANTDKLSSIYLPLRLTYGLVPLVAGADKFFNVLTDWGSISRRTSWRCSPSARRRSC